MDSQSCLGVLRNCWNDQTWSNMIKPYQTISNHLHPQEVEVEHATPKLPYPIGKPPSRPFLCSTLHLQDAFFVVTWLVVIHKDPLSLPKSFIYQGTIHAKVTCQSTIFVRRRRNTGTEQRRKTYISVCKTRDPIGDFPPALRRKAMPCGAPNP